MRRIHWLHVVAVLWLLVGAVCGTLLITFRGRLYSTAHHLVECPRGPCYSIGHPYWWAGILVWIAGILGSYLLWRAGTNLVAGRTMAGWPREDSGASH